MRELTRSLGLRTWSLDRAPAQRLVPIRARRIGLYKSWVANMDEGWTRWLLEQYEFSYTSLADHDIRAGELRQRFDVIVLPHQSPNDIVRGHDAVVPALREGPSNPVPPEYQGGIGDVGLEALKRFVTEGGTLVALDEASDLALERFGGIVRAHPQRHPRTRPHGRSTAPARCCESHVGIAPGGVGHASREPRPTSRTRGRSTRPTRPSAASRATRSADRLLMSGWLLGGDRIASRHAVVEVPYGTGRVVLFGFRPQFRAQPHATFKLLFNALY